MSGILNSSIGRKFAMALSAFFLMVFILQHFSINVLSVFSPDTFNDVSHFMGTFWVIQYLLQPVLIIGVIFHFVMGFVLEIRNNRARAISYAKNNGAANSSWMSRNMIWSGLAILYLCIVVIHFIDFWIPEINTKYIVKGDMSGLIDHNVADSGYRYYHELVEKFHSPIWTSRSFTVVAFVFLSHYIYYMALIQHFQSVGANNKYTKGLKTFSKVYAIGIPLGFIFIALFHHLTGH